MPPIGGGRTRREASRPPIGGTRSEMASVQSSKAGKYARRGMPEDEAPEHVESTGELLIKQLVQKQTNTNVTLRQQLQQKKEFERGVGFVTLDEMGLGTSSLQEFEEKQRKIEKMLEMERRGQAREKMRSSQIEEQLIKASGDSQFSLQ
ncbi:U12 snRNA binding [Homalodisca vitripennis]|nr:U12 snRNA binding [Homalodisca vitripennis]